MELVLWIIMFVISIFIVNFALQLFMKILGADMLFLNIGTKIIAYFVVFFILMNIIEGIF